MGAGAIPTSGQKMPQPTSAETYDSRAKFGFPCMARLTTFAYFVEPPADDCQLAHTGPILATSRNYPAPRAVSQAHSGWKVPQDRLRLFVDPQRLPIIHPTLPYRASPSASPAPRMC